MAAARKKTMTYAEAADELGVSMARLHRLIELGDLHPVEQGGARVLDPREVAEAGEAALAQENANQAGALFKHLSANLKDSRDHVNALVSLLVQPIQRTNEALQKENEDLRRAYHESMKASLDAYKLLGELLKDQTARQIEMDDAENKRKMAGEAFDLFKQQVPIVTGSMLGARFLKATPTEQLELLLENDILTDEQKPLVQKLIAERKAAAAREAEQKKTKETNHHDSPGSA